MNKVKFDKEKHWTIEYVNKILGKTILSPFGKFILKNVQAYSYPQVRFYSERGEPVVLDAHIIVGLIEFGEASDEIGRKWEIEK